MPQFQGVQSAVAVEFSREAVERLKQVTVEGLLALPRVGMGVGGILLGIRERERIWVMDIAPISCSHASGPSFSLTPPERLAAAEMVRSASPVSAVGLYWSRTRGLAEPTDSELSLFRELCPEGWQAMVQIHPSMVQATRAAVYFVRGGGVVAGAEGPLEFTERKVVPELPRFLAAQVETEPRTWMGAVKRLFR